ncbi:hypothetical protein FDE76_16205 [Clostridium botulinum]|uniref:Thoeris protein ThsB TIR-like domain-containing protein n=1 Tax=Clostridium botulinum (strain Eklund 17B / Type B) TaxID=935198 RepID=B2TJD2_CLOBB|nr:conserved hypothetical protein [Clostridium botulinum B str. Eklund 17B (NRP)]MBY6974829.1 TIR domain-containing protein [Clostridium botulinum]MBY6999809.1 TIR domain-containing protein [Clostridium botulinum]MCR1274581.1 TIR domain-containing protein [Clostridium botulinum]NFD71645.1 hypothetical protein [Clostridium botulinum]
MARSVFYSFCYSDDINRTMVVRNRWVTHGGQVVSGIIDKAEFEKLKRTGDKAVYSWIDNQLEGTSVTVVLLGTNTLKRPFVQYEICESIKRGNAVIGVHVNNIKDMQTRQISLKCNVHTAIGQYNDNSPAYFDKHNDGIYDYMSDNGHENLGQWVESAAKKKGK